MNRTMKNGVKAWGFSAFVFLLAAGFASCGNKNSDENKMSDRIENAKASVKQAADKVSDKAEEGADKAKHVWKETTEGVKQGAQKVKKEVKEGYEEVKKKVED